MKNSLGSQIEQKLNAIAQIQKNRVLGILDRRHERYELIASRTQLRLSIDSYNNKKTKEELQKIITILKDVKSANNFVEDITVVDTTGVVIADTNQNQIGKDISKEDYFISGTDSVNVGKHIKNPDGSMSALFVGPILLDQKLIGVLIVRSDLANFFYVVQDYTGLGETGETGLATRMADGNTLTLTPLRYDSSSALRRITDKNDLSKPINRALNKVEATFTDTIDYRGEKVIAVTKYIPEVDWGIVVKIDHDETFAPLNDLRKQMLVYFIVTFITVLVLSFYLSNSLTSPLKNLKQVANRLRDIDFSQRAPESSDEIGQLGKTINQMAIDLEVAFNLLREKHLEAQKYKGKLNELSSEKDAFDKKLISLETKEELNRVEDELLELKEKLKT